LHDACQGTGKAGEDHRERSPNITSRYDMAQAGEISASAQDGTLGLLKGRCAFHADYNW
jgi:hypothetical protein